MDARPANAPKIAIFLPSLEGGGAERVFAVLANGFVQRGYRVDLVLARASGPYLSLLDPRVSVVDLHTGGVFAAIRPLTRYLREARPDAVLAALSHANVVTILAHWLSRSRAPIVVSERLSLNAARRFHRTFKDRLIRIGMRLTYWRARQIVVVASAMIDELRHYLHVSDSKLRVIYNPIINDALIAGAAAPVAHRWLSAGDVPVIVGCGRLSDQKDFPTLLHAFAEIRKDRRVKLIILGEGEDRAALEALTTTLGINHDVDLPGFASNPFPYFRAASVFALSSKYEGMPGALIQAMACGARVVSTDCPTGPEEIFENETWGTLVPIGDATALARAITATMDDRNSPNAVQRANDFSEELSVTHYLASLGLPSHAAVSNSM